jgi:predicted deacylase
LITVDGATSGPTLALTGGIHGDEFEGPAAILRFIDSLDPAQLRGRVLAMPVANPPALRAISRTSPLDGANLARVFPGRGDGDLSERIAAAIENEVIAKADFFIDLHTGGVRYAMPTMAGYYTGDPRSLASARAFGAPVIWGHDMIPPGRTLSSCLDHDIPFLYTEGRGGGRVDAFDAMVFERGLRNVARHLGMLDGELEGERQPRHLLGDGNVDRGAACLHDGLFFADVGLLDRVSAGDRIGYVAGYDGAFLSEYRAESAGSVAMIRLSPSVLAGEPLFLIATEVT